MEIRRLEGAEKLLTRPLYEEAFPEDTPPLVDYYYQWKMAENEVWAALDQGRVVGMLCLNPYRVMLRGREYVLSYIVAVATARTHRRQGVMRAVLSAALRAERAKGRPFTFLKPANVAYYEPFQFALASGRRHRRLRADLRLFTRPLHSDDVEALAFMNRILEESYDIYCFRDRAYMDCLLAELSAGSGSAERICLAERGEHAGMRVRDRPEFADEDCRLISEERYTEPARDASGVLRPDTPFIMLRVLDLPELLRNVFLRRDVAAEQREHCFYFADPLLPENDGVWRWTLNHQGSRLCRAEGISPEGLFCFTPELVTRWLFRYGAAQELPAWCAELEAFRGAYFDEET